MAERFFANLNLTEIKAFLKVDHDPRYTSDESRNNINDDLNFCIKHGLHDDYLNQLMQKLMPQVDFLSQDTAAVSFMTKFLWKTVVKHIDLFFDIINSHSIKEGLTQIEMIQKCLPQFRVEAITLRKDIKDF